MPYKALIQNWFYENSGSGANPQGWYHIYIFIPTRSIGKPYDDTRYLTNIIETEEKLILETDSGSLLLTFFGLEKISNRKIEGRNHLVLAPFKRFDIASGDFVETFTEGEVILAG